jgi:hypothetical protein
VDVSDDRPGGWRDDAPGPSEPGAGAGRRGGIGPLPLILLAVLLGVAALALWILPDVRATSSNLGEAPMGTTVTFESEGGTYRVLSSGSGRPAPDATSCDVIFADGSVGQQVGGGGSLPFPYVPDRIVAFEAPEGPTQVRCGEVGRFDEEAGAGTFHIVEGTGPVSIFVVILGVAAGVALVAGIALMVERRRAT